MESASFTLKMRVLKSEVMGTLLYGCVTWTLGVEHFAVVHSAHHKLLLRITTFHRRQRTDHRITHDKALKKAQCESVETTVSKRRFLFGGAVQRAKPERLTRRVIFGAMVGG